jgi:WD40 repeat protein
MRSHTGRILSVAVDKQHRHLATASDDHTIRIWDLDTLQQVSSLLTSIFKFPNDRRFEKK